MNEIQLFSYGEEKRPVRTVAINGEVWFVAKDVCDILDIKNARDALKSLDDDEKNTVAITDGNRGNPNMSIISEPGLYKLAFKSRKQEAKKFVRWVTHTVLPTIRRTGCFNVSESMAEGIEPSVETGLQRVGLIIRAAEHKAVPQSEQLRLLSIAVKDLTGTELNLNCLVPQKCQALSLMDLPEVFGAVKKGKVKNFGRGKGSVRFYSILEIADTLGVTPSELNDFADTLGVTPSELNDFADEHGLKARYNGEWVRVKTSEGEAREFVYLQSAFTGYCKKEVK